MNLKKASEKRNRFKKIKFKSKEKNEVRPNRKHSGSLEGLDLKANLNMTLTKDLLRDTIQRESNLDMLDLKGDLNMTYAGNFFNDQTLN